MGNLESDYWGLACRVLLECGRARVHNLRNALNAVSLGIELLDETSVSSGQGINLRQQISEAAAEIEGLQTLLLEAAQPHIHTLPEAAGWALSMTRPVARRQSVELVVPFPVYDLPSLTVTEGFSVAFGELLLTACLASDRGNKCILTRMTDSDIGLSVEWMAGGEAVAERVKTAHRMMSKALAPGGRTDLVGEGQRQRITMQFHPAG